MDFLRITAGTCDEREMDNEDEEQQNQDQGQQALSYCHDKHIEMEGRWRVVDGDVFF